MKNTVSSLFPTNLVESQHTQNKKKRVYKLIKYRDNVNYQSDLYQNTEPNQKIQNIFDVLKTQQNLRNSYNIAKPVGERFFVEYNKSLNNKKKMKTQANERIRKPSSSLNNNVQNFKPLNVNEDLRMTYAKKQQTYILNRNNSLGKQKTQPKQQFYKSHSKYATINPLSKQFLTNTLGRSSKVQSENNFKYRQSNNQKAKIDYLQRQIQQNCDKNAFLMEAQQKKSLQQICGGDKYFEMSLRNRFKQDLKVPNFIYQIKEKFTQNKVLSRLRIYKPEIKIRQTLSIKGFKKQP